MGQPRADEQAPLLRRLGLGGDEHPELDVAGVAAGYGHDGHDAVADATLRVAAHEMVALLGANGAGKSTLLRVAAGLLAPRRGSVRVRGHDPHAMRPRERSRLVALLPQTEETPAGFSVHDVVAMGRAPHQGAWMLEGERDRAAVEEAIRWCDLGGVRDRRIETLSGGERRRVAVARALAQGPSLLLLDEPAAFLDVRHRLELYALLGEILAQRTLACVMATHDLDAAARFASAVVVMRAGRVVAQGPPADVLTGAALREAFGVDVDSGIHGPTGERYFVPRRVDDPR